MENKIKLIDIIENPLDLTEKIIVDMLENKGSKYINLMSAIITRAMYEEDPKFERDKVKFIVTGISKDSLIPIMSFQSLLKTESYKFDLIESRYIANVKESVVMFDDYAFDGYIKEKYKFDPYRVFDIDKEILDIIHNANGLAVLAHPKLVRNDEYVAELLNYSFDGVEVYHSKHDYDDEVKYLTMAKERNLFVTGGSDYHGIPNRYPYHLGEYVVDSNLINQFIERIRCISA